MPGTSWSRAFQDPDFKELCDITGLKDLYEKYKAHKDRVEGEAQVEIYAALEKWAVGQDPVPGRQDPHRCGSSGRTRSERPGGLREPALPGERDGPVDGRSPVRRFAGPGRPQLGMMEKTPRRINWHLASGGCRQQKYLP